MCPLSLSLVWIYFRSPRGRLIALGTALALLLAVRPTTGEVEGTVRNIIALNNPELWLMKFVR